MNPRLSQRRTQSWSIESMGDSVAKGIQKDGAEPTDAEIKSRTYNILTSRFTQTGRGMDKESIDGIIQRAKQQLGVGKISPASKGALNWQKLGEPDWQDQQGEGFVSQSPDGFWVGMYYPTASGWSGVLLLMDRLPNLGAEWRKLAGMKKGSIWSGMFKPTATEAGLRKVIEEKMDYYGGFRSAQRKYPLKYRGHTISVKTDDGGGHKAHVHKGNTLRFTSKRAADPETAVHQAKLWVDDSAPARLDPRVAQRKSPLGKRLDFLANNGTFRDDAILEPGDYSKQVSDVRPEKTGWETFPWKGPGYYSLVPADTKAEFKVTGYYGSKNPIDNDSLTIEWFDEKSDLQEANFQYFMNRKAQSLPDANPDSATIGFLQNPQSKEIVDATPEMESLRQTIQTINAKIAEVEGQVEAYRTALANKASAKLPIRDEGKGAGMEGVQMEVARLTQELESKLKLLPQNFIRFQDQTVIAKTQYTKINDASWKDMIDAANSRGRGVMRRVASILNQLSILFKKLTVDVKLKEFAPGEFDEKAQKKILKKNEQNEQKIKDYQEQANQMAPRAQKYFLDNAEGRMQTPRKGQLTDWTAEFDLLQELIESLQDAIEDIQHVNDDLKRGIDDMGMQNMVDDSYPLPDVRAAGKGPFNFSSVHGTNSVKVRRVLARKLPSFSPTELRQARKQ